jgi:hypothetical protein
MEVSAKACQATLCKKHVGSVTRLFDSIPEGYSDWLKTHCSLSSSTALGRTLLHAAKAKGKESSNTEHNLFNRQNYLVKKTTKGSSDVKHNPYSC